MIVICCGMYRAASTWQYNVACHLIERFYSGERLGYLFDGNSLKERLRNLSSPSNWIIVKAHEPDPFFAELLSSDAAFALYSYRDIRDVAYSVAHKRNSTFEREIEGTDLLQRTIRNFRYWTSFPRSLTQRYEQITVDSVQAVREIATVIGISLSTDDAAAIATEFSLENNKARIDRLTESFHERGVDLSDPTNALCHDEETLLHWNHIRDGRIGGWRQVATPRQLVVLARGCGHWLIEQGYESDWSWVQPALKFLLFEDHAAEQEQTRELVQHLEAHRESLATLHQHLAAERAQVAAQRESLMALHEQLATERKELVMLREHVHSLRGEGTTEQERIKELVQHLEAHRESLATLHEHLAAERAEVVAQRESLATLHEHLAAERAEVIALREQVQMLQYEQASSLVFPHRGRR